MESTPFAEALLPTQRDAIAPDGSQVRLLVRLPGGSMAHFELGPGEVSRPTQHRTVSEAWYIVQGLGRMWRRQDGTERDRPAGGHRAHDPGRHGVPVPQHRI
jgi:quercetin dioxygenase-like cupin family protein